MNIRIILFHRIIKCSREVFKLDPRELILAHCLVKYPLHKYILGVQITMCYVLLMQVLEDTHDLLDYLIEFVVFGLQVEVIVLNLFFVFIDVIF